MHQKRGLKIQNFLGGHAPDPLVGAIRAHHCLPDQTFLASHVPDVVSVYPYSASKFGINTDESVLVGGTATSIAALPPCTVWGQTNLYLKAMGQTKPTKHFMKLQHRTYRLIQRAHVYIPQAALIINSIFSAQTAMR